MASLDSKSRVQWTLQKRMGFFHLAALGLFLFLLLRLWQLQVLEGDRYEGLAQGNRLRLQMEEGCRGLILDRAGVVLARNRPSFDVLVTPAEIHFPLQTSRLLSDLLKIEADALAHRIEEGRARPYEQILVKEDVGEAAMVGIQERKQELEGVTLRIRPLRSYPKEEFAAHLLGYVSEISPRQLSREENRDFRFGDRLGQGGVEGAYDALLRGVEGGQQVEVDAAGHEARKLGRIEPKSGFSVVLTLDARIQELAEEGLRGQRGVVVAMNPKTGEILALASKPSYDPNLFASRLKPEQWARLAKNPHHPLQNRALQSAYPPGSIFKLVTAIAALRKGVITPETRFHCDGAFTMGDYRYGCWKKEGHGTLNLKQAIAKSCNVYFYNVALRVGIEEIAKTAKEFGLGIPLDLGLCQEARGLVPTPQWKRETKKEKWYLGNTIQAGIGQGMITATPLQILQMVSAIANGGRLYQPMVIREIKGSDGQALERYESEEIRQIPMGSEVLSAVHQGMWAVVNDGGTGALAKVEGLDVCGKTATAQVVSRQREASGLRGRNVMDHAWFTCFAPESDPQLAMVVLVEHGGHGGVAAAQVAKHILEGVFSPTSEAEAQPTSAHISSGRPPDGGRAQEPPDG